MKNLIEKINYNPVACGDDDDNTSVQIFEPVAERDHLTVILKIPALVIRGNNFILLSTHALFVEWKHIYCKKNMQPRLFNCNLIIVSVSMLSWCRILVLR